MENYRRNIFITKLKYQLKFTAVVMAPMIITAFVIVSTAYFDFSRLAGGASADLRWENYILKAVLLLAAAFIAGVFFSHRVVGPVHRLEEAACRLNRGDFNVSVKLRAGDEFMRLSRDVNDLAAKLRRISEKYPRLSEEMRDEPQNESSSC